MKKKLAITGLSGVIGYQLLDYFPEKEWQIFDLYHTTPTKHKTHRVESLQLDLLSPEAIKKMLYSIQPDYVLHMAAATHIDACEGDKKNGIQGFVWKLNVEATKTITLVSKEIGSKVVFMSTECVFGNTHHYCALEDQQKEPLSWYGYTKAEAENYVARLGKQAAIIRSVIAYSLDLNVPSITSNMASAFKKRKPWYAVNDQLFAPTHISDIQKGIFTVILNNQSGVLHVVNPTVLTPFDFAKQIAHYFGYDASLVQPQTLEEFFGKKKASYRLQFSCLNPQQTIKKIGFTAKTVAEVINEKI